MQYQSRNNISFRRLRARVRQAFGGPAHMRLRLRIIFFNAKLRGDTAGDERPGGDMYFRHTVHIGDSRRDLRGERGRPRGPRRTLFLLLKRIA